jgi:hypothetical protein
MNTGYRTDFTLFIQSSTLALNARLEIRDPEKVSVPAGDFDCYRVEIKAYEQSNLTLEMTYWVSNKPDRQVVKVLSASATYELTAVANRNDQALAFQKGSLRMSLTAPLGWVPLEIDPLQPGHDLWLSLISRIQRRRWFLAPTRAAQPVARGIAAHGLCPLVHEPGHEQRAAGAAAKVARSL